MMNKVFTKTKNLMILIGIVTNQAFAVEMYKCFFTDTLDTSSLVYTDKNYNRINSGDFEYQGYQIVENDLAQVYLFDKDCRKRAVYFERLSPDTLIHGRFVGYHSNGKMSYEGEYHLGKPLGVTKGYYENGKAHFERRRENNSDSTFLTIYGETGKKDEAGYLYKGRKIGWWKKYKGFSLWGKKFTDTFYENPQAVKDGVQDVPKVMREKFDMDTCLTSKYFVYFCHEKQTKNAKFADEVLSQAMPKIISKYNFEPEYKIGVSLFKNKQNLWIMSGRMRNEKTFIGMCLYSKKMLLLTKSHHEISKTRYRKTLVHELTHAILAGINGDTNHVPSWFNEGLAEIDSENQELSLKRYKWLLKDDKPFKNFKEFKKGFKNKNQHHAYIYAYYTVSYIEEQYGVEKINEFVRNPNNFKYVFGIDDEIVWNDAKQYHLNKRLTFWQWIRSD